MKDKIAAVGAILLIFAVAGGVIWALCQVPYTPQGNYSQSSPEQKPFTKTRCDFTGVLASSIIAEERKNGYRFDGRVSTFLCGENGLSFSLIEEGV